MTRTSRIALLVACGAALVAVLLVFALRPASPDATARESEPRAQSEATSPAPLVDGDDLATESAPSDASAVRAPALPSQPPSPSAAPALLVEVRDPSGEPAVGVTVTLARKEGESVLAHATTSADGTASFGAFAPPIDLYVLSGEVLCRTERLDDSHGRHVVSLDDSVVLRGTVLVDGAAPTQPMRFSLRTPFDAKTMRAAPRFVALALWGRAQEPDHPLMGLSLAFESDASGHFAVYGLLPSWRGELHVPSRYLVVGSARSIEIADPLVPLTVRLRTRAAITGRAVHAGTREPAPGANGTFVAEVAGQRSQWSFQCDDEGRFHIRLHSHPVARAQISIGAEGGRRLLDLRDVPEGGLDLGDVPLDLAVDVCVLVRNAMGEPIFDAAVRTLDGSEALAYTEPDGLAIVPSVLPTASELEVSAFGYELRRCAVVPLSATAAQPLEVVLQAGPLLDVRVNVRDDESPKGLIVHVLSWDAQPFEALGVRSSDISDTVEGADTWGGHSLQGDDGAKWRMRAVLGAAGHLRVANFQPRERALVRLLDGGGQALDEREIVPAMLVSRAPIVLTPDGEPRTLALEIVDPDGEPLAAASIGDASGSGPLATSNSDGKAFVENVYAGRVDVTVRRRGFAPQRVDVVMDAPVVRRRVVMEPGRTVSVCVVDAKGRRVDAERVEARANGRTISRGIGSAGDSCKQLQDLPSEPVELVASVAGRIFRMSHDPRSDAATIIVPDPGSLRVELGTSLAEPRLRELRLRDEADPSVSFWQMIASEHTVDHVDVAFAFPGTYTVELVETDLRRQEPGRVAARAEHVTVRANEWSTVRLTKP